MISELSSKFGTVNTTTQYQECMSAKSRTAVVLREVSKAPSEMQLAISIYIALKFVTTKRQIWNLLSGSGKSRIIPALGLMLLTLGLVRRVHVLIPGAGLLKRDRDEYGDYWELAGYESSVQYHDTTRFEIKQGDVVLVDEADYFAFSEPLAFGILLGHLPTICFTGTSPDAHLNKLEDEVLAKMGLASYTYWPSCLEAPAKPQVSKVLKVACDEDLVELLEQFIEDKPVLLITSDDVAAVIVTAIVGVVHVTQDTEPDSLRRCDTCSPSGKFTVFVVTDRLVVRGTDFRAPLTGITEIID